MALKLLWHIEVWQIDQFKIKLIYTYFYFLWYTSDQDELQMIHRQLYKFWMCKIYFQSNHIVSNYSGDIFLIEFELSRDIFGGRDVT